MSFVDVLAVLSREEKASVNGARRPKGDHREVAMPAKKRFKQTPPPPIEVEEDLPRFQIWRKNESGATTWVLAPLGEVSDTLAIQLGWWSFGEPFPALDMEDGKIIARKMMLDEEEAEQSAWLQKLH